MTRCASSNSQSGISAESESHASQGDAHHYSEKGTPVAGNEHTCHCGENLHSSEKRSTEDADISSAASPEWATGHVATLAGDVLVVSHHLSTHDRLGGWAVRWGFGRNRYTVPPGLYAVGCPGLESPVLVSANYKFTFDLLRCETVGLDAWLLILDTHGINVWCAAGKGHFGTEELVRRIESVSLAQRIHGRTLVLPQLGAPGVCAHDVKRRTGFRVIYGPVRIKDLQAFLTAGMKATLAMRTVRFGLRERMAVTPVEIVGTMKYLGLSGLVLAVWAAVFSPSPVSAFGTFGALLGAVLVGTVLVPLLLPWIPGRAFSVKGWLLGLAWAIVVVTGGRTGTVTAAGCLLFLPAVSAFLALNYTGSSAITSQTGVNREIHLFARPIFLAAVLGIVALSVGYFMR